MFGKRQNSHDNSQINDIGIMALVIKKIVDLYFYLNDEISGELDLNEKKNIHIDTYAAMMQLQCGLHIKNKTKQNNKIFENNPDTFPINQSPCLTLNALLHFGFCFRFLHFICYFILIVDPRVRNWLFMSNPFPVFGILACYLYFILKWGPEFMRNRKPFNLNKIIIIYNMIQIVACARLVMQVNDIFSPFFKKKE